MTGGGPHVARRTRAAVLPVRARLGPAGPVGAVGAVGAVCVLVLGVLLALCGQQAGAVGAVSSAGAAGTAHLAGTAGTTHPGGAAASGPVGSPRGDGPVGSSWTNGSVGSSFGNGSVAGKSGEQSPEAARAHADGVRPGAQAAGGAAAGPAVRTAPAHADADRGDNGSPSCHKSRGGPEGGLPAAPSSGTQQVLPLALPACLTPDSHAALGMAHARPPVRGPAPATPPSPVELSVLRV
ncbi:hypothetical protein [Streptomyces sp. NRRL S-1868]|uniref:hypothetical protein n=1 Tax=Streptomyces sp. NRRL S-1868 TaxID=1463892 RepID=UPI00131C9616|nr:hypothetical protein [Streptomyces sp. NRRL S-1868]